MCVPGKWPDPVKVGDELGGRLSIFRAPPTASQPTADVVPQHEGTEGDILALFHQLGDVMA